MGEHPVAYSVIVPTHDRPAGLGRCLRALMRLEAPKGGYEVIVVDDGGNRPALPVVQAVSRDSPTPIRHHRQPNAGPATARNTGANLARGGRLVFTDDDCAPQPGWLVALARAADDEPGAMLGGVSVNACRGNPFSEASQLLIDFLQQPGPAGHMNFVASNNLCVGAARFRELGGFDTGFPRAAGEDREWCDRWIARGWPVRLAADARVDHHHRLGPLTFWRQHMNYGRGARRVWALRRAAGDRPADPSRSSRLRFYGDLVRYPLSRGQGVDRWAQAALLGIAQAATTAGYFLACAGKQIDFHRGSVDTITTFSAGPGRPGAASSTEKDPGTDA